MRKTSIALENRHFDIAEEMVDNGDVDNQSEMVRTAIDHYAHTRGYHTNGDKHQTRLRTLLRRLGDAFGLLAVLWIGLTFYYPLELRGFAIPFLLVALTFHATDRLLATREPALSHWLTTALTARGGD